MLSNRFLPIFFTQNFYGVNAKDTDENMLPGEWTSNSIDVYSEPQGAIGSRPGFSALTSASIGTAAAWCGFYEFQKHSGGSTTSYYMGGGSDGKVYNFVGNSYVPIYSGLDTTLGINKRFSFFTLNNVAVIIPGAGDLPLSWAGTGSATTIASAVTADFGIEWQRYGWLHSTVDPRLIYYSALDTPNGGYPNFLNFDYDQEAVSGISKQADDMIVGKQHALYRVQYRGTDPLFKIYRIPSNIGPINHEVMKEIPGGAVIFLAADYNFYMLAGDTVVSVGDNIKDYIASGVKARLKYAVGGLLYNKDQYWCSFTKISGDTTNDRTVVMDWSRPYQDVWGKTQFPWFIYSIPANCFAEVTVSGEQLLYHGGYVGKMYKDDTGTNDDGAAFNNSYQSKRISMGDPTLEKKFQRFEFSYENSGAWNLVATFVIDDNAATEKIVEQDLSGGISGGALFDQAYFDVDYFVSESDAAVGRAIDRQGKKIQVSMGTTGLDESWLVREFFIHAKPLRRTLRTRESS